MIEMANADQMTALGLAMRAHSLTPPEAAELWLAATAGVDRALTAAEAVELTERVRAMPIIPTELRGPACDAWPFGSWPRRTRRRHNHGR